METGKLEQEAIQIEGSDIESPLASSPLVRLENVVRTYRTNGMEVLALRGVDLSCRAVSWLRLRAARGRAKRPCST
jgi:hypothetical protein